MYGGKRPPQPKVPAISKFVSVPVAMATVSPCAPPTCAALQFTVTEPNLYCSVHRSTWGDDEIESLFVNPANGVGLDAFAETG